MKAKTLMNTLTKLAVAVMTPLACGGTPILLNPDFSSNDHWRVGYNSYWDGALVGFIDSDYAVADRVQPAGDGFVFTSWPDEQSHRLEHFLFQEFTVETVGDGTAPQFNPGDLVIFRGYARSTKSGDEPLEVDTQAFIEILKYNGETGAYAMLDDFSVDQRIPTYVSKKFPFELSLKIPNREIEPLPLRIRLGFEIATESGGNRLLMDEGSIYFSNLEGFLIPADQEIVRIRMEMSMDGLSWWTVGPGRHATTASNAFVRALISPGESETYSPSTPVIHRFPDSGGAIEVVLQAGSTTESWKSVFPGIHSLADRRFFRVKKSEGVNYPATIRVDGGTLSTDNSLDGTEVDTFYIGRTEVTLSAWQRVRDWAQGNGYDIGERGSGCGPDYPVHSVNWLDVIKWCNAKSEMEGFAPVYTANGSIFREGEPPDLKITQNVTANGYRLPTEAEWDFAARGGRKTLGHTYSGSNDLNAVGWYRDNSNGSLCAPFVDWGSWPVAIKAPNELGLYDMSGNVAEWCFDPVELSFVEGSARVVRGGSFYAYASRCSLDFRLFTDPGRRTPHYGFRIARSSILALNEIRTDQSNDPGHEEYVEIKGPPGANLDDVWFLYISEPSGEGGTMDSGVIEQACNLSGYSIPADGIFLMVRPEFDLLNLGIDGTQVDYVFDGFGGFHNADNVTALLVRGFTGNEISTCDDPLREAVVDIDDANDGVPDPALPWAEVLDAVSLIENQDDVDNYYGSNLGGIELPATSDGFVVAHAYRAGVSETWHAGEFVLFEQDGAGNVIGLHPEALDTPGTGNRARTTLIR